MLPLAYTSLLLSALSLTEASPLKVDLKKPSISTKLAKRWGPEEVVSTDGYYYYFADLEIGTPGQSINAIIDTGSLNLITSNCTSDGCYTPGLSSTSALRSNATTSGEYADGSEYVGSLYNDTVSWGDLSLEQFLVVSASVSDGSSVMGISFYAGDETQFNFVDQLHIQGTISRRVFNLYKSIDGTDGGVVFGGLNTGKYEGSLETIANVGPGYGFYVAVSGVSTDCDFSYESIDFYVVDSGSQLSYIPEGLFHTIHQQFGGVQASPAIEGMFDDSYMFKCQNAETVYFDFSGKKIAMDPESFLLPLTDASGAAFVDDDGDEMCTTSLANFMGGLVIGANLLPNMFVVFDMESGEMSIAQAAADGADDLVEITGDVPGASYASLVREITVSSDGPSTYPTPTTSTLSEAIGFALTEYTGTIATACPPSSSSAFSSAMPSSASSESFAATASRSTTVTYNVGTCFECSTSMPSSSTTSSSTSSSASIVTVSSSTSVTYNVGVCLECSTSISSISSTTTEEFSTTVDTITSCSGGCTTTLSPPPPSTSSVDISSSIETTSSTFTTSSEIVVVTTSSSELISSSTFSTIEPEEPSSSSSELTSSTSPVPTTSQDITSSTVITTVFTTDSTVVTLTTTVPCSTLPIESTPVSEPVSSTTEETECVPSTTVVTITTGANYFTVTTTVPCETQSSTAPQSNTTTVSPQEPSSSVLSQPPVSITSTPVVPEVISSEIISTEEDTTITIQTQITLYTTSSSSSSSSSTPTPVISTTDQSTHPAVSTYNGDAGMVTGSLVLLVLPFLF